MIWVPLRSDQVFGLQQVDVLENGVGGAYPLLYLFILSCLILASSVERGIPSLAAARFGLSNFSVAFGQSRFDEMFPQACMPFAPFEKSPRRPAKHFRRRKKVSAGVYAF